MACWHFTSSRAPGFSGLGGFGFLGFRVGALGSFRVKVGSMKLGLSWGCEDISEFRALRALKFRDEGLNEGLLGLN